MSELIHYHPYKGFGVRCLNGSAHARGTVNINEVTCPKCKDPKTASRYWYEKMNPKKFKLW